MGFGVWGLMGFEVWGLGFGAWGSGCGVWGYRLPVLDLERLVADPGIGILHIRYCGFERREPQDLGFWIYHAYRDVIGLWGLQGF